MASLDALRALVLYHHDECSLFPDHWIDTTCKQGLTLDRCHHLPRIMASARLDYQRQIYLAGLQGIVPQTTNLSKLEVLARKKLDESKSPCISTLSSSHLSPSIEAYWYVAGAASTGSTHQGNLAAFKRYKIVPRMLNNVSIEDFDTSIELFGKTFSTPLLVAPIGVQAQLHPEADMATARAAAQLDVPFVLSSAASVSMERVAEANGDGCRWFQLVSFGLSWLQLRCS